MPGEKLPLLARAVGGRVLGPRPGRAIVSFWQGIVEIILRVVAMVASIGAIVPGALALTKIPSSGLPSSQLTVGRATAAIVLCVAVVGLLLEVAAIIVRFLNIGLLNLKSRLCLTVDVILSGIVGVGYVVALITSGYSSHEWKSYSDSSINHSFIAAAILSFVGVVAFSILAVWMLLFVFFKWNKHVITYTLKDAVLG